MRPSDSYRIVGYGLKLGAVPIALVHPNAMPLAVFKV